MTQEEKARAYDEALKCAKMYYKENKDYNAGFLPIIFPELAESEDERMLQTLIRGFENWKSNGKETFNFTNVDDILAYLEKQKEHQNESDAQEKTLGRDLTFPQGKDKDLDEIAQDYVDRVKEYNPEPTWDLMQTAVCYGYYCCEQKEQKTAEWNELQTEFRNINEAFEDGKKEVIANPEKYGLCKSIEWGKEDEIMLKWIEDILLIADSDLNDKLNGKVSPITDSAYSSMKLCIAKCLSWLKSLCPQPKLE